MRIKSKEAVSPVIGVILMVAITVVLAAVVYLWVIGFFSAKGSTPTVNFTSTKIDENTANERYLVSVVAPSRNDIAISAVKIKVINAAGTILIDKSLADIYSKKVNDARFNDDGDCILNAGDSFYLYTTTYHEADKVVLVYVPTGSIMGTISLSG